MKIFVFIHTEAGEREFVAEYDMTQVPRIGEGMMTSLDGDLVTRPVLAVHHFLLASDSQQGAFLIVGEPTVAERSSVIAPLLAS